MATKKKYDFNISYSLLGLYKSCQRNFYYTKIAKMKHTDFVTEVYGKAGSIVHDCMENYYNSYKNKKISKDEIKKIFDDKWEEEKIDTMPGFFGHRLKKPDYWNAVVNGLNKDYNITKFEENIEFNDMYKIKGFIDAVVDDGDCIVDWKTNSNIDEKQKEQLKYYAYLYYRKHKRLPSKYVLEYLKINKKLEINKDSKDAITIKDVHEVKDMINNFIEEVHAKDKFADWKPDKSGCTFCGFKSQCERDSVNTKEEKFILEIKNGFIYFRNPLTEVFKRVLDKVTSYEIDNKEFVIKACAAKGFKWDGIVHHFKSNKISIGFYHLINKVINDYATATKKLCPIEILDKRKTETKYDTKYKENDIILRDYQSVAIDKMIRSKIGIIGAATGGGKTIISAEIIKRQSVNTLFVIDNKTLMSQTKKEYEDYLGVDIGTITEGDMNIVELESGQTITVCTIQTIMSRLKKKDKEILKYLKTVQMVIWDEAQLSKSKSYITLHKKLTNCHYYVGLTGTPGKDKKQFVDMQYITGDVIYEIKAKTLIDRGVLTKPVINFLTYDFGQFLEGTYQEAFEQVTTNKNRNRKVIEVIKKHNKLSLILVSRVKHGQELAAMIEAEGKEVFFIRGAINNKKRDEILNEAREGHPRILIGTASIVSKGLNLTNLEILINTTANVSDIQTIQSLGRLLRKHENKEQAIYYDFLDDIKHMKEHSEERIKQFEREGHDVNIIQHL